MGKAVDPIWDALEELFGEVRTRSERGRRNLAVRELREAGATPGEIRIAFNFCQDRFKTFTEMALAAHFSRAQHVHATRVEAPTLALLRKMAERDE